VRPTNDRGRVTKDDIAAKLGEIRGDVEETAEAAKPTLVYIAVGAAVTVVVVAFLLGRARGRRKSTVVEVRRR
jgi:hypothetical protein